MGADQSARGRWARRAGVLGVLAAALALPSGALAQPTDAQLLSAIQAQAPATLSITSVTPSANHARLAITTSAQPAESSWPRAELWVANDDGSALAPAQSSPYGGGADDYSSVGAISWSSDSSMLLYESSNSAVKPSTGPRLLTFNDDGTFTKQTLAGSADSATFTADGRYVVYTTHSGWGYSPYADSAYDIASGHVFTARWYYPSGGGQYTSTYAPECKRAQDPDWVPAQAGGRWIEQALSSPDPGCRFGANANDPGKVDSGDEIEPTPTPSFEPSATPEPTPDASPTPMPSATPSPSAANDAPSSITQPAQGTGLVPIAERGKPLGPTVRFRSSAKGLTQALRRGLRVKLDLIGAKTLKAYLIVSRPADEELFSVGGAGTRDYTVGRFSVKNPPSQTQTIAVPFTSEARAVMPRFLKITVTVRLVADDRAGNRTIVERQVPLTDF